MKKAMFLLMTVMFTVSIWNGKSQNTDKEHVKTDNKEVKKERVPLRKLEGKIVSLVAQENFEHEYGKIPNVKWRRGETFDEAVFTRDGKSYTAFFGDDGRLVGTTNVCSISDLPAKGQKEINEKFKDYTVGKVIFYDDNEFNESDMMLYGLQFDDMDNYFVEMAKGDRKIVVRVDPTGYVELFTTM